MSTGIGQPPPPSPDDIPLASSKINTDELESDPGTSDLSNSPFAKMFPGGASKEQLQMFIGNYMKLLISQIKREDEHHKANLQRQRRMLEGQE